MNMELEPKVFRTIVFVRHGQYSSDPEKLTKLGRRQALLTAKALSALKPSKIHCSTMPRAVETAGIICSKINLKAQSNDMFCEGFLPGTIGYQKAISKGPSKNEKKMKLAKARTAKRTANIAFKTLFMNPLRGQNLEIVVAHGNVIRYWVCKALDIPEEKWLKMDVSHASLTTIRISKSGKIVLLGFADSGHLPVSLRTYV